MTLPSSSWECAWTRWMSKLVLDVEEPRQLLGVDLLYFGLISVVWEKPLATLGRVGIHVPDHLGTPQMTA